MLVTNSANEEHLVEMVLKEPASGESLFGASPPLSWGTLLPTNWTASAGPLPRSGASQSFAPNFSQRDLG